MPEGSKVHKVYEALKKKGYSKEKSAKIAQAQTGESLKTGESMKNDHYENGRMKAMNEIRTMFSNSGFKESEHKRDEDGKFSKKEEISKDKDDINGKNKALFEYGKKDYGEINGEQAIDRISDIIKYLKLKDSMSKDDLLDYEIDNDMDFSDFEYHDIIGIRFNDKGLKDGERVPNSYEHYDGSGHSEMNGTSAIPITKDSNIYKILRDINQYGGKNRELIIIGGDDYGPGDDKHVNERIIKGEKIPWLSEKKINIENGRMRAMNEIDQKLENSGIKRDKQGRFSSNGSSEKETDWDELKSKSTEKKISGEKESDKSEFPDKSKKVGWYVKGEYKK